MLQRNNINLQNTIKKINQGATTIPLKPKVNSGAPR